MDPETLARLVQDRYALSPPVECVLLQKGDNDTYLVRAGSQAPDADTVHGKYALRLYRRGHAALRHLEGCWKRELVKVQQWIEEHCSTPVS